jgi:hypothetical protein
LPLLLSFPIEYAIRKVEEYQMGWDTSAADADDVNLLGHNMDIINRNTNFN